MQQGGLSASFPLVASATQSRAVDQRLPLQQHQRVVHKLPTTIDWTRRRSLLTHVSLGHSRNSNGSISGLKTLVNSVITPGPSECLVQSKHSEISSAF